MYKTLVAVAGSGGLVQLGTISVGLEGFSLRSTLGRWKWSTWYYLRPEEDLDQAMAAGNLTHLQAFHVPCSLLDWFSGLTPAFPTITEHLALQRAHPPTPLTLSCLAPKKPQNPGQAGEREAENIPEPDPQGGGYHTVPVSQRG